MSRVGVGNTLFPSPPVLRGKSSLRLVDEPGVSILPFRMGPEGPDKERTLFHLCMVVLGATVFPIQHNVIQEQRTPNCVQISKQETLFDKMC